MILTAACAPLPSTPGHGGQDETVWTVDALRAGEVEAGRRITVADLAVVSPRARDRSTVFVQDVTTGSGLRVLAGDRLDGWPPAMGTAVTLDLFYVGPDTAPTAWVFETADIRLGGDAGEPVVAEAPEEPTTFSLARWPDVTVRAEPDPVGRAPLDIGRSLDGSFPVALPGLGHTGDLTGIVLEDGAVAPRTADDWTGPLGPGPVTDAAVLAIASGDVEPGTTVAFEGTVATPPARDRRYAVVQVEPAVGVWVDAEGWIDLDLGVGDVVDVQGVVVSRGGQPWVRTWWEPEVLGRAEARVALDEAHGSIVEVDVTALSPPDAAGRRRSAEGWVLDPRFLVLEDLPSAVRVRGAIDRSLGERVLAVTRRLDSP